MVKNPFLFWGMDFSFALTHLQQAEPADLTSVSATLREYNGGVHRPALACSEKQREIHSSNGKRLLSMFVNVLISGPSLVHQETNASEILASAAPLHVTIITTIIIVIIVIVAFTRMTQHLCGPV